jgi:hypothetical protein
LFPGVPVHKKIRNYHTSLVAKFGVFQFLTETLKTSSGTHELHSQLHWYPARPKTNIQLHHDTVGSTFFVILHYFSDRTIYGPEFVFDTVGMQNPFHRADQSGLVSMHPSRGVRQGPVDVDGPWPQSLRDRMKAARVALNEAYGNRPMIKNALIPPNGALGFVDELVHHTTPLMDRRTSPEHQKGFSTVIIRDQNLSAPESFSFPSVTRERSTSFELKNDSMNRTAMTATRDQARAFMRIWVAVRKK